MNDYEKLNKLIEEIRKFEQETGIRFYMKLKDTNDDFLINLQVEQLADKSVKVFSSSLEIVENINDRHDRVLRKYDEFKSYFNVFNDPKIGVVNLPTFTVMESTYKDKKGEERRCLKFDQEATDLIISMFNTPQAIYAKKAYIVQFHLMKQYIKDTNQTEDFRNFVKSYYRSHTDILKEELQLTKEDTLVYIQYANMINQKVIGMSKARFCKKHNIPKGKFRDYLTDDMLKKISELEKRVDAWIQTYKDEGFSNKEIYEKVKSNIENYQFRK